jgi:YfiH family protein
MNITANSLAGNNNPVAGAGAKPAFTAGATDNLIVKGDRAGMGYSDLYLQNGVLRVGALDRFPELVHGLSLRDAPDGEDWNLSAKRGSPEHPPDPAVALQNRAKLAGLLGISLDRVVGCRQVHGTLVARVGEVDAGKGMRPDSPSIEGADALVTDTPGLYLMALSADCPPVFFYDPEREVGGLAHSGWKGTIGRIAGSMVEAMVDEFGCDPRHIVAVVGPGIGPCCYSVGENVIVAAEEAFAGAWDGPSPLLEARHGLTYFNLRESIRRTIVEAGVPATNVTVEEVCTAHNLNVFYSHRGDKGQCGLFGAVVGLKAKRETLPAAVGRNDT